MVRKEVEAQPTTLVTQLAKTRADHLESCLSVVAHRNLRQKERDPSLQDTIPNGSIGGDCAGKLI